MCGRTTTAATRIHSTGPSRRRAIPPVPLRDGSPAWGSDGRRVTCSSATTRTPYWPPPRTLAGAAPSARSLLHGRGGVDRADLHSLQPRRQPVGLDRQGTTSRRGHLL